jgi:hypothetical protein
MKTNSNIIQLKNISEKAITDVDLSKRKVSGYLASFGIIDSDKDLIEKGSFRKSITERGPNATGNRRIAHLYQHEMYEPIGKILELKEDNFGLFFVSELSNTTKANDILTMYQEGILREHSIGFKYVKDKMELIKNGMEGDGYYSIKELNLFEGSTVTFGANEFTPYLGSSKSFNQTEVLESLAKETQKNLKILTKSNCSDELIRAAEYNLLLVEKAYQDIINTPNVKADLITLKECEPLQIENEKPKIKSFYQLLNQQM